jgi:hypothetical protein
MIDILSCAVPNIIKAVVVVLRLELQNRNAASIYEMSLKQF